MLNNFDLTTITDELMSAADRRDFLSAHVPACPSCQHEQVQLMSQAQPAQWRCRVCKHAFVHEPAKG